MRSADRIPIWKIIATILLPLTLLADKASSPSPNGMRWANSLEPEVSYFWLNPNVEPTVIPNDDDLVFSYAMPFAFNYYGQNFSTVYVSTNGFLTFNNITSSFPDNGSDNLSTNQPPDTLIAAYWDNLTLSSDPSLPSRIDTFTVGSAPYRKFVISYGNFRKSGAPGDNFQTMQIVLHETTNIIKVQYQRTLNDPEATVGIRYPLPGGETLLYSFNDPNDPFDQLAVLYYPSDNLSANGVLDVSEVVSGTSNQTFNLTVNSLQLQSASFLQNMGKADVVRIGKPFFFSSDTMTVSGVWVDGESFFLGPNNPNPPTQQEITTLSKVATWYYDTTKDSLYIQLPPLAVNSSVRVKFQVDIPSFTGGFNFDTHIFSRLERGKGTTVSPSVQIVSSADSLIAIPPVNNRGVVNTLLSEDFTVRVEDNGGNPVQDVPISFSIFSKPSGSENETLTKFNGVTSPSGLLTTQIRFGNKTGIYRIRAFAGPSTNPQSVDFSAIALPDAPDSILIVSGNNQSGAFGQPLPDSVRFRLVDQYLNPIPDTVAANTISFNPQDGFVNPPSRPVNGQGEAATAWTLATLGSPQKLLASASGPGLTSDTVFASGIPGTAVQLALVSLRNISANGIPAVPGENITVVVEARDGLGNPVPNTAIDFVAEPGFNVVFQSNQVITNDQGRAVNVVTTDQDNDSTFFRAVLGSSDELTLRIYHLNYVAGSLTPTVSAPGQSESFQVTLNNPSNRNVTLNTADTRFRFDDGTNTFSAPLSGPTTLVPGDNSLTFASTLIDANFASTSYTPMVFLRGQGENASLAGGIDLPGNSLNLSNVQVNFISLDPDTVTTAAGFTFTVTLSNSGSGDFTLDPANTFLVFGSDNIPLKQSYVIPGGGQSVGIDFVSAAVQTPAQTSPYSVTLQLSGTRNGLPFNTTLSNVTTIQVQKPPRVVVETFTVTPTTVAQNQEGIRVDLKLRNQGSNRAATRILPQDIRLSTSQLADITTAQTTPIVLGATESSELLPFFFSIAPDYPPGADNVLASYRFTDTNSGETVDTSATGDLEPFTVLSRAQLNLLSTSLTPNDVLPGQTGVELRFTVQNTGQSTALVDSVGIAFINNHTLQLTSPATLPASVAGGAQRDFVYNLDVDPSANFGIDLMDLTVRHADQLSGKSYIDIAELNVDTLSISESATPEDLQIQVVQVPQTANRGQTNIAASLQLKNLSTSSLRVDSLFLLPSVAGTVNSTLTSALPSNINGGVTATFNFILTIPANAPLGTVLVDARYVATDLSTGQQFGASGAVSVGVLEIKSLASFIYSPLTLLPNTVSEGQDNIVLSTSIKNGDATSSAASLTDVQIVIGAGGDSITAQLVNPDPLSLPFTLLGGQSVPVQFLLSVADSSLSANVDIRVIAQGQDLTDLRSFSNTSPQATLTIQQKADLQVTNINVVADSAFVGQDTVSVRVGVQNKGQASAQLNNVSLILRNRDGLDVNFPKSLQTLTLPQVLSQNQSTEVRFRVEIPDNIILPSGGDSTVFAGATLSGQDLNTAASLSNTLLAGDSLIVVSPAVLAFDSLLSASLYDLGTNVALGLQVRNTGGAPFQFTDNTVLRLVKESDPDVSLSTSINLAASADIVAGNGTALLVFQSLQLSSLGRFRLFLDFAGTVYGQTVTFPNVATQTSITVGGDLAIQVFEITPATVTLGQTGISASLTILNNGGAPLPIDAGSTRLLFNYTANGDPLPINAVRQDTQTELPPGVPTQLQWLFNIPSSAASGEVAVEAQLSFGNGSALDSTSTTFVIESGALIEYVSGSLTPAAVVPGESVAFRARFINRGTSDFLLNSGESFLQFSDNAATYQATVNGKFAITGIEGPVPDTSEIVFRARSVADAFGTGVYGVRFKLFGQLPNSDTLTALDSNFASQVSVLEKANLLVDAVSVVPDEIVSGQDGITVEYTLRNFGQSPAVLQSATSKFEQDLTDISSLWSLQNEIPVSTINPGQSAVLTRVFAVSPTLSSGQIRARLDLTYSDQRTPAVIDTFSAAAPFDTVGVVELPTLRFSGQIVAPAGAIDRTVSTQQTFTWRLAVSRKPGSGPLQSNDSTVIRLDFTNSGFFFNNDPNDEVEIIRLVPDTPDSTLDLQIWAGDLPGVALLSAVITDTTNAVSGDPARLDGPNTLNLLMTRVKRAELVADLDGPTIIDFNNELFLRGIVRNEGTAGLQPDSVQVALQFDDQRFNLVSGSSLGTYKVGEEFFYSFVADPQVTSNNNKFRINIASNPLDVNANTAAFQKNPADSIFVNIVQEAIGINLFNIAPSGAVDSVLSSGQAFTLRADYTFGSTLLDTGRTAVISQLPPGYSASLTPINLDPDDTGSITWEILAADSASAPQSIVVSLQGFLAGQAEPLSVSRSIAVQTVTRAQMAVNAAIVSPSGAVDRTISTGQMFDMNITVTNEGVAETLPGTQNRVRFVLPDGFLINGTGGTFERVIATDSTTAVTITAPDVARGPDNIAVNLIQTAQDENSNKAAAIIRNQANIENLVTVPRTDLALSLTAAGQFSADRDSLPVTVTVRNVGQAALLQNAVTVELEIDQEFFEFSGGPADSVKTQTASFSNGVGNTTFYLSSLSQLGSTALTARLLPAGLLDENADIPGTPVFVSQPDSVHPVEIIQSGAVNVSLVQITAPAGAVDDTVSTGQSFTVSATVNFAGNIAPENRTGRIILPPGFSTDSGVQQIISPQANAVEWTVTVSNDILQSLANSGSAKTAPNGLLRPALREGNSRSTFALPQEDAQKTSAGDGRAIQATDFVLGVEVSGQDASGSGQPPSDTAELTVTVVERARVTPRAQIVAPAGAISGTISTFQPFDIKVWVENQGEAPVAEDSNQVTLTVPSGFSIQSTGGTSATFRLKTGEGEADTLRVQAPVALPATQPVIQTILNTAAGDANSGAPALIQPASSNFNVAVENRAALRIDSLKANIPVVGLNQEMRISGLVSNVGDAGVAPNDSVSLRLNFDPAAFELLGDTTKRIKLRNKQAEVTWRLRSRSNAPLSSYELVATIDPAGSWDENSFPNSGIHLDKGSDTSMVEVVNIGTFAIQSSYIGQPGTDSLAVSTGQTVPVVVKPQILGDFSDRTATLFLSESFAVDSLTAALSGDSVRWTLPVPNQTSGVPEQLVVRIRGVSSINGALFADTDTLILLIQRGASLVLDGSIVQGAVNNTVSQGQSFTYEARIANQGEAGILASPSGQLTLTLGEQLSLLSGAATRDFAIGDSLQWEIQAQENTTVSALLGEIEQIRREKVILQANTRAGAASGEGAGSSGVESQSDNSASPEVRTLNDRLSGLYQELNTLAQNSFVKVTVSRVPLDANSAVPADTAIGSVRTPVTVAEKPEISLLSLTAPETFSTEQMDTLVARVSIAGSVVEQRGRIKTPLPGGFRLVDPADTVKAITNNVVQWAIRAPTTSGQNLSFEVEVEGRDATTNVLVKAAGQVSVSVERKAVLSISTSGAALGLSRNEPFSIEVLVNNSGEAGVLGNGELGLTIGNNAFQLNSPATQSFTLNNGSATVSWDLVAPDFNVNTVVGIGFTLLPLDENTGQVVNTARDTLLLDLNMVPSQLEVSRIEEIEVENSYVQGKSNLAVLGLAFTNPNTAEPITVHGFQILVSEGTGNQAVSDIHNLISRSEVVTYPDYRQNIDQPIPGRLGERLIDETSENPFELSFSTARVIAPGTSDTLVVRIDLTNQAINRNFSLQVSDVDARGASNNAADVIDALGIPIANSPNFKSSSITILSTDPQTAFRNYPNPFGPETQIPGEAKGITRFSFVMENGGTAELAIYTLFGRLVWKTEVTDLTVGLQNRAITWDGRNGQGQQVVNGVYVAVLRLSYNTGSSETLQTKVAVVK